MTTSLRFARLGCLMLLGVLVGPLGVHAQYVQIQNVSPTGAVTPGTPVSFNAAASGFTDPVYALADSFSGAGATLGSIDKIGFFTWTPGVYDAGHHTLTVTVTDSQEHAASSTITLIITGNTVILSGLTPGPVVAPGRTVTFSLAAPGFTNPSYQIYDSLMRVNGTSVSGSIFSWTPGVDDRGVHVLTIVGSDAYGHTGQVQQTLTVADSSVTIQSIQPGTTMAVGTPVSFMVATPLTATTTYTVSDTFSAGTSTITASNLSSAGFFTWTPATGDIGTHVLTLTATDGYGNTASTTLPLWVTSAPTTPTPSTPHPLHPRPLQVQ